MVRNPMVPALVALLAAAALSGPAWAEDAALSVGDDAPGFSLPGSDGKTHSLEDHLGKRAVVIAWFPKAFTGG